MKVCYSCGATLNSAKLNCESCGVDIPKEGGIEYGEFINKFGISYRNTLATESKDHMSSVDGLRNSAAMIDSLFIPAEKDSLIQLASFVAGQIKSTGNDVGLLSIQAKGVILSAWIGKAHEIGNKLNLMGTLDSQLEKALNLLQSSIEFGEDRLKKAKKTVFLFYAGLFVALAAIGVAFLFAK